MAHNPLGNTERRLLNQRQGLFAGKPHAAFKLGLDFPSLQLGVNAVPGSRHNNDSNSRLVQQGDIPHEHREQRVVHKAVFNLQYKELALEPVHITEDFPDEPGNFEMLGIEIGHSIAHDSKDNKTYL